MNDLQKELQELKAKVAELESRIVAEPVAKWQPKGGQYYVECLSSTNVFDRETKEQAERAAVDEYEIKLMCLDAISKARGNV